MNDEKVKSENGQGTGSPQTSPSTRETPSQPLEKGLNEGKLPDFQFTPPPPDPPKTED